MERTDDFIRVWFWARDDVSVPIEVKNGAYILDTSDWVRSISNYGTAVSTEPWYQGIPSANFPNTNCDIPKYFGPNYILINLTFCLCFL